jgi:hypothetical protein
LSIAVSISKRCDSTASAEASVRSLRARSYFFSFIARPAFAQPATELSKEVLDFVKVSRPVVALTHVRVIDGTGAQPLEDQTLVIVDGKIKALGKSTEVKPPEGAEILNLNEHTSFPAGRNARSHVLPPLRVRPVALYPEHAFSFPACLAGA